MELANVKAMRRKCIMYVIINDKCENTALSESSKIIYFTWRRERDSDPRSSSKPLTRLAGECLQPLGHLSKIIIYYIMIIIYI